MRTKQHFKYVTGIVVPCYNEEERLQFSEFSRFFKKDNTTFFCFVDDGSTDGTKKIVTDFVEKNPERAQAVFLSFPCTTNAVDGCRAPFHLGVGCSARSMAH